MESQSFDQEIAPRKRCEQPNCLKRATRNSRCCRKHNDKYRWQRTQNARQARHRLNSRRDVVQARQLIVPYFNLLDVLPDSPGARTNAIWERLAGLDRILFDEGPSTFVLREKIRSSAHRIRRHFMTEEPRNADDVNQYFHSLKLIVDVGVDDLADLPWLRRFSAEVLAFHLQSGDVCRLAMAVMRHANVTRLLGSENKCRNLMRSALHLLRESSEPWTPRREELYHNVLFHNLRFFGEEWDWDRQKEMMNEIVQRAHDRGTPGVQLETLKEQIRHWGSRGKLDMALKYSADLEDLLKKNRFPRYGLPCLLRPKIHALLATDDFHNHDAAIELIYQYREMYLGDKHCYYYTQLLRWKKQLELGYDVPPPTYGSMIFTYLPRDEA